MIRFLVLEETRDPSAPPLYGYASVSGIGNISFKARGYVS